MKYRINFSYTGRISRARIFRNQTRWWLFSLPTFSIILFSFLICSCSKKTSPKRDGQLNLNITQDPTTLDPRKGADFTSSTIQFLLFEGLVKMTPYSTVSLGIAEKIDVSEDLMTYTFFLRDAKWSNGKPITSFDFVQTWRDMLDPGFPCPNSHLLFPIKNAEAAKKGLIATKHVGIRATDHKTIEIYLERPTPFFLEMLSFCVFFPVNQNIVERSPRWADCTSQEFVCNGPYKLAKWKKGSLLVLEKNPLYWDAENVNLERIHITIVDNEMTALKMYEKDELDILGLPFTGIPSDSVPSLLDKGLIKTTSLPASTICCFNMEAYPFHNRNIRKAFAYAINRKEIIENISFAQNENGIHILPKILLQNQPGPFFQDGDTKSARLYLDKGLKELGITQEELGPISLVHASSGIYSRVAQALQQQWREVLGLHVELRPYDYKIFLDKLTRRDYQMGQCIWIAQYHDPMNFFERFKTKDNPKNYPSYQNEEFSSLLEASLLHKDQESRFSILGQALSLFMEEMPLTAIYHWNTVYLQKPRVKNLKIYPTGSFHLQSIILDPSTAEL